MNDEQRKARLARWKNYHSATYRRWRVYSTFLTGFLIGLLYVIIISERNIISQISGGLLDQRTLILIFSGIMGGVIYTILVDGHVDMPRFVANKGDQFEAGLFGDILLGIAGAIVLDFLSESMNFRAEGNIQIAALGIVGGYGGRAILQFALSRMFSDINVLEEDRQKYLKAAYQQKMEAMDGLEIIDQLNTHIQTGLTNSELAELTAAIRQSFGSVRKQVFDLARDFRRTANLSDVTQPRIARTIPIFKALIDSEPDNHQFYAEAAFAYKDSGSPDLFKAIQYLDKAIETRGDRHQADTWKYELCRAITRIQQVYETQHSYNFDAATNERIIEDLLAVAKIYNLGNILKSANEKAIPIPVWEWIYRNRVMLESREDTKGLVSTLLQSSDLLHAPTTTSESKTVELKEDANLSSQAALTTTQADSVVEVRQPEVISPKPELDAEIIRWRKALAQAKTQGASTRTANQDRLSYSGVKASHKMAENDWPRVKPYVDRFWVAAKKFKLPPELLAAIASRESRGGNTHLLVNGWGDHGNAFGIMQVDRNYHTVAGAGNDPADQEHINQATGILASYIREVRQKHPTWDDSSVLEGGIAAYNFGVRNVQTKERMNAGTTGDDYGADVLARAQFYSQFFSKMTTNGLLKAANSADTNKQRTHQVIHWIEAVKDTWLKKLPEQSDLLLPEQKKFCEAGTKYGVESYEQVENGHFRVNLAHNAGEWYIFDSTTENHWDTTWENDHDESGESTSAEAEARLERTRLESNGKQPIGDKLTKEMPFDTLITPHIAYGELTKYEEARRFTQNYQCKTAYELCRFLEKCREHFGGKPVIITSGHRPEPINTQQKGAQGSEHLYDQPKKGAIDFRIKDVNIYDIQNWCLKNYPGSVGKGAHKGFVHIGIRPGPRPIPWNY